MDTTLAPRCREGAIHPNRSRRRRVRRRPSPCGRARPSGARTTGAATARWLDLFAALDVRAGTVIGARERRHRGVEFRAFLDRVERSVPPDLDVHLVLDDLKTHKTRPVHDWLVKRPRRHLHLTPTGASRLNLVECWFAPLSRRRLARGAYTSVGDLEAAIHAHTAETDADPKPFVWAKTADGILARVARFCQRTSNSGH